MEIKTTRRPRHLPRLMGSGLLEAMPDFAALMAVGIVLLFHFPLALNLSGGFFIPIASIPILALLMLRYRPQPKVVLLVSIVAIAFVGLVVMLSDLTIVPLIKRTFSGIQLVYIMTFSALFVGARPLWQEERSRYAKVFLGAAVTICVLGILEITTPFKIYSDMVRGWLYPVGLYESDARDLVLAGHIRPKVFASEPSHAAWCLCECVICYLAFTRRNKDIFYALTVLAAATAIFVSPGVVVVMVLVLIIYIIEKFRAGLSMGTAVGTALFLSGGLMIALALAYGVFGDRFLNQSIDSVDRSTYLRVIQPFDLVTAALDKNVFIGVGFAGLESIWTHMSYIEGGAEGTNINASVGMALLTIPTFSGLLGIVAFSALCWGIVDYVRGWTALQVLCVLLITLLQKQSFVITTAWIVVGIWIWAQKSPGPTRINSRAAGD